MGNIGHFGNHFMLSDREPVSRLPTPARSKAMARSLSRLHDEITAAQKAGNDELAGNLLNDLVDLSIGFRTPTMPCGELSHVL